jgi:hypothetical protein
LVRVRSTACVRNTNASPRVISSVRPVRVGRRVSPPRCRARKDSRTR